MGPTRVETTLIRVIRSKLFRRSFRVVMFSVKEIRNVVFTFNPPPPCPPPLIRMKAKGKRLHDAKHALLPMMFNPRLLVVADISRIVRTLSWKSRLCSFHLFGRSRPLIRKLGITRRKMTNCLLAFLHKFYEDLTRCESNKKKSAKCKNIKERCVPLLSESQSYERSGQDRTND